MITKCYLSLQREKGKCNRCGKKLVGRQRRWCSSKCAIFYSDNHSWTFARFRALKRVGGSRRRATCDQCGNETNKPEVNHVDPRYGRGYGRGCWNHQTNLQVLCHTCHLKETYRQKKDRMILAAFETGAINEDEAQEYLDAVEIEIQRRY